MPQQSCIWTRYLNLVELVSANICAKICYYYTRYISADDGTEEYSIIEPKPLCLSSLDGNREESVVLKTFKIISSPKNQGIEIYWSCQEIK